MLFEMSVIDKNTEKYENNFEMIRVGLFKVNIIVK